MDHKPKRKLKLTQPFDITLGYWLMGGGLLLALLESIYFAFLGYDLPVMMLVLPATLILLGLSLIFFDFVETELDITDDLANLPELVRDDLEDLRRFRLTRTHLMVIGIPVLLMIQFALFVEYKKWSANWGGINVLLIAIIVGVIGIIMLIDTQWFRMRALRTPNWIIFAALFGFAFSGLLGIAFTEPHGVKHEYVEEGVGESESSQAYDYDRTRVGHSGSSNWYWFDGGSVSGGSCDEDACMFIVLFIIIVVVIIASAAIPHFWVVGTSLMIAVFLIQTLRELLYVDPDHPAHPWYAAKKKKPTSTNDLPY